MAKAKNTNQAALGRTAGSARTAPLLPPSKGSNLHRTGGPAGLVEPQGRRAFSAVQPATPPSHQPTSTPHTSSPSSLQAAQPSSGGAWPSLGAGWGAPPASQHLGTKNGGSPAVAPPTWNSPSLLSSDAPPTWSSQSRPAYNFQAMPTGSSQAPPTLPSFGAHAPPTKSTPMPLYAAHGTTRPLTEEAPDQGGDNEGLAQKGHETSSAFHPVPAGPAPAFALGSQLPAKPRGGSKSRSAPLRSSGSARKSGAGHKPPPTHRAQPVRH